MSDDTSTSGDFEHQQKSVERFRLASWMEQYGSVTQVQRKWAQFYGRCINEAPVYRTITRAREDALTFGLADPPRRQRKWTARTDDAVEHVIVAGRENPVTSQRRLSSSLGLSKTTIQRTLKENKLRPYRLRILPAMLPGDTDVRLRMAELMLQRLDDQEDIFRCESIMFTDETTFTIHARRSEHQEHSILCY